MTRNAVKFLLVGLGIVVIGLGVLYGARRMRLEQDPDYQASQWMERLKEQYANDTYGGNTPEETLRLFVDALKKGDTDLAAKYFVIDEQEKWSNKLTEMKKRGFLSDTIRGLEQLKTKYPLTDGKDDRFIFEAFNDQKELILQMDIARGANNKWKILDL